MKKPRSDTWMPFYVGDYLRDTGHLTTMEHGAYLLLLMHAWTHDGVLPNDDRRLLNIAKMGVRDWKRSSCTLRAFFYVDGDTLRHRRIDRELANSRDVTEQRRAAGKASAVARNGQRKLNGRSTGVEVSLGVPLQQNARPSPSPLEKKENTLRVQKTRKTQIAAEWQPNEDGVAYAKARGVTRNEVSRFVNHHIANGNVMANWDRAWMKWCDNAVKFGNATPLLDRAEPHGKMVGALG